MKILNKEIRVSGGDYIDVRIKPFFTCSKSQNNFKIEQTKRLNKSRKYSKNYLTG